MSTLKEVKTLKTQNVSAIGPYNLAVEAKNAKLLFTSGMIGLDPNTNELTVGVENQATQALENLKNLLSDCNASFDDVVKTTVFLTDLADFAKVNAIYQKYFTKEFPARSCVQVAALPKAALVEIELIVAR